MDLEALGASPVGKLVPIRGTDARHGAFEYFAFVPAPLPPSIALEDASISAIQDASLALGRLDAAAASLVNPSLLVRPALTREAVSTSALEGTFAPAEEVLEGELLGAETVGASAREILNYIEAADRAMQLLAQRPISMRMICELQAILVKGTRGETSDAGSIRNRQVIIGSDFEPIERARFVPPPPGMDLERGMDAWERWIHNADIPLLVRVAVGHYQFEALHPFSDGNGRLGRLIVALQLVEENVLRAPLLSISEWLEPRKSEYKDRLLALSGTGNFAGWIAWFCRGIAEQATKVLARIQKLDDLRASLTDRIRISSPRSATAIRLAGDLIGNPLITTPWVAKRYGISYPSASNAIQRLVDAGVLRAGGARRGKTRPTQIFVAPEVLTALSL